MNKNTNKAVTGARSAERVSKEKANQAAADALRSIMGDSSVDRAAAIEVVADYHAGNLPPREYRKKHTLTEAVVVSESIEYVVVQYANGHTQQIGRNDFANNWQLIV